ncbi:MAG TPA: hypothetical protein VKP12_13860, partial [Kiloniellaceae bacterium]|nr:hypothetical protein [Kiloniellaceae bacterium]
MQALPAHERATDERGADLRKLRAWTRTQGAIAAAAAAALAAAPAAAQEAQDANGRGPDPAWIVTG